MKHILRYLKIHMRRFFPQICPVFYHVRNHLNYIAHIHVFFAALWRRSITNQIDAPSPIGRGWDGDISIEWIRKAFPDEVELLLVECQEELEDFEDVYQGSNSEYE